MHLYTTINQFTNLYYTNVFFISTANPNFQEVKFLYSVQILNISKTVRQISLKIVHFFARKIL